MVFPAQMKIISIKIENFRCLKNETVKFDDYTCLVGPNGAGKSTVLNALNVFFREAKSGSTNLVSLSKEDFHEKSTTDPIRITVTFGDLSQAAKDDLKDYVRHDQLVVSAIATWNETAQIAIVTQHGSRLAMKEFARYFRADGDGRPVSELKTIFAEIKSSVTDLPSASTKAAMAETLRTYESAHPEKCVQIESSDEFYGVSKGAHKLGKYVQWIFIPAVKDAASEQTEAKDTALGRLMERTVRAKVHFTERIRDIQQQAIQSYDALLDENQPALKALSDSLTKRLGDWSHRGAQLQVRWDKDPQKSVRIEEPVAKIYAGDEAFLGEVTRLGHGLQRSYMFALLQELSGCDVADAPRLLLGIEEPELFQHPPQAQHLADVLAQLSTQNAQVFACTHSPYFVSGKGFENVRLVRAGAPTTARSAGITFKQLSDYLTTKLGEHRYKQPQGVQAKINQALQPVLREMFFAPKLVLVEGLEDVALITAALNLIGKWDEWRSAGCHLVPVGGKSELVQPLAIAQLLSIPVFVIFDADGDETNETRRNQHKVDNERLLKLLGSDPTQPFPAIEVLNDNHVICVKNLGEKVRADYQDAEWTGWKSATESELGQPGGLEKNSMFIAGLMEKAWAAGRPSPTLVRLCELLLKFAAA
jgi:energy-coupling factor transporter ATP-binding protein EcfA2